MSVIVDCRELAKDILTSTKKRAQAWSVKAGRQPGLAVIRVGTDPASQVYFESKKRQAQENGLRFFAVELPLEYSQGDVLDVLNGLVKNPEVDGIMLELPLPAGMDPLMLQAQIPADKDVEGVSPANLGKLFLGLPAFAPCTAKAAMFAAMSIGTELKGKQAVIVGASNIVGKPLAVLLLQQWVTVEICHIFTQNLPQRTKQADLLFVAAGVPDLIKGDMVKEGAIVIDIGINLVDGKVVGDTSFNEVERVASYITPVPGGVGALTTAMLLENVVEAAEGCKQV